MIQSGAVPGRSWTTLDESIPQSSKGALRESEQSQDVTRANRLTFVAEKGRRMITYHVVKGLEFAKAVGHLPLVALVHY